ncbi:unnamed protein product [Spodoptera littoralis]|uniref:CHK kinase-like domain-containing protein n=1 Tax=Spodoptera littoralis TaxID=7109 RepID=A0A9P0HUX1_SPOLI|nr:unnamed protein product [Spodoptera littoralis]CAH1634841.1 unnamed protein product [Spodoptera littoralis]
MAQHNFEGDVGNLNEHQIQFINKVIEEQGLSVNKVVFQPVGKAGDNFVANVKRINIEGENGSLKMVVKIASQNEFLRQSTNTEISFSNENFMYTEVLPKLVSLQKAAGVPEKEHLRYAKCFGALSEAPNEVIMLEDLNESEFVMLSKFKSLTDECGQKLEESIMIDYQGSKNGNPVMDLLFMIFNCTDHETRSKHYYDWLDYYHSELDRSLSYFDLSADSVYPRRQLDADIKKYKDLLFAICIMLTNIFTRNTEEAAEMMETLNSGSFDEAIEVLANTEIPKDTAVRAKKRITGIVESFIELGLL